MKTFYTLGFILIFASCFSTTMQAQDTTKTQKKLLDILPLKDGKVTYTNTIQVDSVSQEEIYKRAKEWLAHNYEFPTLDEKDELVSRGYILYGLFKISQTITIKIKYGKYKYEITDFTITNNHVDYPLEGYYGSFTRKADYKYIDRRVNEHIASLEQAIKKKKEDVW